MGVLDGLGMWIWEAQHNQPEAFCATLKAHRFSWIAVKAHDGATPFNTGAQIDAWRQAAHAHGLVFGIWGYLTGHPQQDANTAISLVGRYRAQFYIADAEVEYERAPAGTSGAFCQQFRRHLPHLPTALSSFGRVDLHRIDWRAWRNHQFAFMPQAYECESSALTPTACVQHAEGVWPRAQVFPTVGTYRGARGVLSGSRLHDSLAHLGMPGVSVWDSQAVTLEQLAGLARLKLPAHVTPPPRPKPPPAPGAPHRDLHLTSPLMRGPDVLALQRALNLARLHGHKPLKLDGIYGPSTQQDVHRAAWELGLVTYTAVVAVQRLIEHPGQRNPVQIRRAHQRAQAAEHAAHPGKTGLAALPALAAHYIGVSEHPAGSNRGLPFPSGWEEHFGMNGVSWCGCFAGSMILAAGGHVTSRVAYCPFIEADAKAHVGGFDRWEANHRSGDIGPGWLVLYCWDGSGVPEHVGIVESLHADHLVAIEGNTSGSNPSDGGMVARVARPYAPTVGFARPRF